MSLRAIRTLESARRKFFITRRTSCLESVETNVFGLGRPK